MSMMGQHETNDIFVCGVKSNEFMISGLSVLLYLFHYKNKTVYLSTMSFLIFGIQIKIPGDLLCPTMLILPHPTLVSTQLN